MYRLSFTLSAIFLVIALCGCKGRTSQENAGKQEARKQYLTIKGSDTMVHLASTWAESFMQANSDFEVSVTGGGSGTGIAALLNGTTDICAASRKMKEKEMKLASEKGIQPQEFVVARDGIAVVVHPSNPVSELSIEQIGKVFTGEFTNWNQIGGPDEDIIVLSRESSSGTYVFFQKHVLNEEDYTRSARLMPATSAIIQSVSVDQWAVGYVGLGYAVESGDKVKMLSVKADENSQAIAPSERSVSSGKYSIARPLHLYTAGWPEGIVRRFINFCISSQGQKIVQETGYVAIQ